MLEQKKLYIECECGTHLLQVTSDVETFDDKETNTKRFRQEFLLAMFYYSYHKKPNFWERLRIIWNYLKTGKMHDDQLMLHPDEAKKLALFIADNIIKGDKEVLTSE
jgi:hypothetical protein